MAKFKRSIQPGGFRPEQVSTENERRLQEYSNRIIDSLRTQRDAEISNRNNIAAAMEENAKIESRQAAVNQDIQQQNIDTKLKEQQDLSKRALQQYETRTKETQSLYSTVADFSLTASKKLREIEVERLEKKDKALAGEILMMGDNHPAVKALKALKIDAQVEEVDAKTKLNIARQRGADPLEVDEALKRLNGLGYHAKTALLTHVGKQWRAFLTEFSLNDTEQYTDSKGNKFTAFSSARTLEQRQIVAAKAFEQFEAMYGVSGQLAALKQESGYYDKVFAVTQNFVDVAGKFEHEDNKQKFISEFSFKLRNAKDAAQTKEIVEADFQTLAGLVGYEQAHNILQQFGEEIDTDANYPYSLEGIAAAKLGPNGEAWGDYWEGRLDKAKQSRVRGYNSAINAQETNREAEATNYYRKSLGPALDQQLAAAPPQQDKEIIETAKAEFYNRFGVIPRVLLQREAAIYRQNKVEAEAAAALVSEKIRIGTATQGDVLSIADPTLRAQAQTEYVKATKVRKFGENYDVTLKAVKNAAKQIMGDSLEGAASFEAERLNLVMQKNFAADYEKGLTLFGGDTTRALQYASDILEKDKTEALANNDPKARYYSETGPNNQKVFKNVRGLESKTNAQKQAALNTLRDTIGTVGVSALDSPGILGSEMELRKISEANRTGKTLVLTPEIILASQLLGIGLIETTNTAIAAMNQTATVPITPLTLDPVNRAIDTARPETVKLFTVNPTLNRVERGGAEIAGTPLRDPSNMRFNIRQYVTGDPTMQGVVRGADSRAVIYDPKGHGGQHEHGHYELSSVAERVRMEEFLRNTIDPFTGQPYRITSVIREGDPGAHGAGTAIDVAPPLNLPVGQEPAWYAELNKRLGYNPLNAD